MRSILVFIIVIALLLTNVSCTISRPNKVAPDININLQGTSIKPTTPKQIHSPTPTITPIPSYWEPGLIYFDDFDKLNEDIWTPLERKITTIMNYSITDQKMLTCKMVLYYLQLKKSKSVTMNILQAW